MNKTQLNVLAILALVAVLIFMGLGLAMGMMVWTNDSNTKTAISAAPMQHRTPPPNTLNPTATATRVQLQLPTAAVDAEPSPPPTKVVGDTPTTADGDGDGSKHSRETFLKEFSDYMNRQRPDPQSPGQASAATALAPPPTAAPQTGSSATVSPAEVPIQNRPLRGFNLPSGEWEYYATTPWGAATDLIFLTINPEDARAGRITYVGTTYGRRTNPCEASFHNLSLEYLSGDLGFTQFTSYASIIGKFSDDRTEISILIDDYSCTDDVFGILKPSR